MRAGRLRLTMSDDRSVTVTVPVQWGEMDAFGQASHSTSSAVFLQPSASHFTSAFEVRSARGTSGKVTVSPFRKRCARHDTSIRILSAPRRPACASASPARASG